MKYSVHRALAMLKTTKARIERELSDKEILWVRVARGQEDVVSGIAVKDIQRDIQAHYDRITALISNYTKIKAAVIRSNAGVTPGTELRKVEIAGQALTVAEIIELVDTVYGRAGKPGFKAKLLSKMKNDYGSAQRDFDDMQERVDEEVSQYVRTLAGKKREAEETDATAKSLIEATSKMLHEQKDPRIIDPLKIADKIKALENEIEAFRTEADAILSEQNALTTIELDLTEVK